VEGGWIWSLGTSAVGLVGAEIPLRRCKQGTTSRSTAHGARSRVRNMHVAQAGAARDGVALVWWDGGPGCAVQGVLSRLPWLITQKIPLFS